MQRANIIVYWDKNISVDLPFGMSIENTRVLPAVYKGKARVRPSELDSRLKVYDRFWETYSEDDEPAYESFAEMSVGNAFSLVYAISAIFGEPIDLKVSVRR